LQSYYSKNSSSSNGYRRTPGPEEREQIEQLLAKINRALDLLDGAGASGSD
jgi:hypothetical protein